jgi:outer membrane protein
MRLILVLGVLEIVLDASLAQAVTLKDSFRAALSRSELVASQRELLVQQDELLQQAQGSLLPTISATASELWQQVPPGGSSPANPSVQPFAKLSAQQPLFRGFREFAGIRQARDLVQSQEEAWIAAAIQLYKDVATSFYSVVALEKDLANLREEMSLYGARVQDLERWMRIGRSRQTEVLTVQSAQAALAAQAEQVRGQIRVQRALFSFLTGFAVDFILQDTEDAPPSQLDLGRYLSALGNRPDVKSAERAAVAADEGISVARGAHLPSADLFGNYYLYRTGSLQDVNWDIQLVLTLPIYQGGVLQSRVRQAESQKDQADLTLSRARRLAEQEVRQAFEQLESDRHQERAFAEALDLARRNYQAETREYRLGLVTNLDVLNALTAFQESQRSLDRAKSSVKLDFASLEAAVARRPGPDLVPRSR